MSREKIIAVVVDTSLLTLYRPDGSTIEIPQGDPRVRSIIDQVLPLVENNQVAEINLELPSPYKDFEAQSTGIIKLFRVLKNKVQHIFDPEMEQVPLPFGVHGPVPQTTKNAAAVDEILAQAMPVNSPKFSGEINPEKETIIAVVGKGDDRKILPEAERLKDQMAYSAKNKNTKGMENLIARLSRVIEGRAHSVQDVLRFLEKSDLPIADDGSIIAYKVLRTYRGTARGHVFVDCHTQKVEQRVGSFVCVDESLVDKNRYNECSNGLHIARRGYLKGFGGDVCVLTKIAPEDIITVPHGDANKVRVCGYHILNELSEDAYSKLKNNAPMTGNAEAAQMVSNAIAGKHIGKIEEVRIKGQHGSNVVITPLGDDGKPKIKGPVTSHTALDDDQKDQVSPAEIEAAIVKVNNLQAQPVALEPTKEATPTMASEKAKQINRGIVEGVLIKTTGGSRQDKAQAMYKAAIDADTFEASQQAGSQLMTFKKSNKVSWEALGISSRQITELLQLFAGTMIPGSAAELKTIAPAPEIVPEPEDDEGALAPERKLNNKEQAAYHYNRGEFALLWAFKIGKKKSWETLGFEGNQITQIMNNKPK